MRNRTSSKKADSPKVDGDTMEKPNQVNRADSIKPRLRKRKIEKASDSEATFDNMQPEENQGHVDVTPEPSTSEGEERVADDAVVDEAISAFQIVTQSVSAESQEKLYAASLMVQEMLHGFTGSDARALGHPSFESYVDNFWKMTRDLHARYKFISTNGRDIYDENGFRRPCHFSSEGVSYKASCLGCKWKLPHYKQSNTTNYYCVTCQQQFSVYLFFCANCRKLYSHYPNLVLNCEDAGHVNGPVLREHINKVLLTSFQGPIPHDFFRYSLPHMQDMTLRGVEVAETEVPL